MSELLTLDVLVKIVLNQKNVALWALLKKVSEVGFLRKQ